MGGRDVCYPPIRETLTKFLFELIDVNNFYASCERIFRPDLHNKPVAVLSNNDGCVIARSNEVKSIRYSHGGPFI